MPASHRRVVIRPATRDDIPVIVAVGDSAIREGEDAGFSAPAAEQPFADVGRLSAAWQEPNRVRTEEIFVAEVDGRVVGCVTTEDRGEALELVNIDVAGELQGQGIGRQIVSYVEARARSQGKRAVTLGTSRNVAGIAWKSLPWWLHLGYQVTHEEVNEWTRRIGPGAREIRMRKDLS